MKIVGLAFGLILLPALAFAATPEQIAAGKKIVFSQALGNCLACHAIAGGSQPGDIGPPLKDVKAMIPDRKMLYAIIFDEEARNPQTMMPPFGRNAILSSKQINEVVDFLYTK
ncbi:MAG: sulfur oxidation c-type cytochrome SoxX [Acetobacteraceae bacterium]